MTKHEKRERAFDRSSGLFSNADPNEADEREEIDYKMVTFSLGGKDYGVDIMKVAEIAKFDRYTCVPNTPDFVSGVYNLRGDIISLIDMRRMFHLPVPERAAGEPEEGLILRLDGGLIGVIVDRVDEVVGIPSRLIQPPHPIFADVNLRSISGVVEHASRLYIILDMERILGEADEPRPDRESGAVDPAAATRETPEPAATSGGAQEELSRPHTAHPGDEADLVAGTLRSLSGFVMTDLNRAWVAQRLRSWRDAHDGNVEIRSEAEVQEFLRPFYSPYTRSLWGDDYLEAVRALLPPGLEGNVHAWNPGCGAGYESYSIACLLRDSYTNARIRVWAADTDLLDVSMAPSLVLDPATVPAFYDPFVTEVDGAVEFTAKVRETVLFEFSDVTHHQTVPPCDLIVIRDVLSFLQEEDQRRVISLIAEQTAVTTLVVTGAHEDLHEMSDYVEVSRGPVRAYRKG